MADIKCAIHSYGTIAYSLEIVKSCFLQGKLNRNHTQYFTKTGYGGSESQTVKQVRKCQQSNICNNFYLKNLVFNTLRDPSWRKIEHKRFKIKSFVESDKQRHVLNPLTQNTLIVSVSYCMSHAYNLSVHSPSCTFSSDLQIYAKEKKKGSETYVTWINEPVFVGSL